MNLIEKMKFDPNSLGGEKVIEVVRAALSHSNAQVRVTGSARCYVSLAYMPLRKNSAVAKSLESAGFKITKRPNYKGYFIYVGYDNCSGLIASRAESIAKNLRECGIPANADFDED